MDQVINMIKLAIMCVVADRLSLGVQFLSCVDGGAWLIQIHTKL